MSSWIGNRRDPRYYQIATLGALLVYGILCLDLEVSPQRAGLLVVSALGIQWGLTRWFGLPRFDPRSPLISALSLCLLLRTNSTTMALATVVVAIGSKFFLRTGGRHLFNPTNFGLVFMLLVTDQVWVSPGQWGSGAILWFFIASLGGLVIYRASRSDVTYAFLLLYAGLVFSRAAWLGDPVTIPMHQLQSGAFLLFAFFMLSDPKTTPDSRAGRMIFAAVTALGGAYVQFVMFQPHGLLYSLVLAAGLSPLINRLVPGRRYEWNQVPASRPLIPIQRAAAIASRGSTPSVERSYA